MEKTYETFVSVCLAMCRTKNISFADFCEDAAISADKAFHYTLRLDEPLLSESEADARYIEVVRYALDLDHPSPSVTKHEMEMFDCFRKWRWGTNRAQAYMIFMVRQTAWHYGIPI